MKRNRTEKMDGGMIGERVRSNAAIALMCLAAAAWPTTAFSPAPRCEHHGSSAFTYDRFGSHMKHIYRPSSWMFASEDGDVKQSSDGNISADDEEDDETDIITQKLRRNAENGPINPIAEHDKMLKENEDEANASTEALDNSTSAASSTLYSHMLANALDPDFDPTASTDEAYIESQMKSLLTRKGKELSRLGPGIATLPLDPSSDEAKSEDILSRKENELQGVIAEAKSTGSEEWDESNLEESPKKQTEILEKAHKLQSEIDQLHVDDCGAVLLANLAFYEAFSLQDKEVMRDVWWQSPSVLCIHPSHPPLIGSNAVCESFDTMFENGIKGGRTSSGGVFMTPANIRGFSVRGTTASLVCDEEVYSKGTAGESISREGGELVNKLLTTNVFRKIGGTWKMVHRHASWHPDTTAAHEAMKAKPGIVLFDDDRNRAKSGASTKRAKSMTLRKLKGDGTSVRPFGHPPVPSSLEGLDANAVLGIPKPKEEEKKPKGAGEDGMIGKIINLSDLLGGGGDSDDDKDEDKGIGDVLADLLGSSPDASSTSTTGSGTPEDPFITRRVFKIGPDGMENLGKDKGETPNTKGDDGDDEDEKNIVIDLRDKSDEEKQAVLSQIVGDAMKDAGLSPDEKSTAVDASLSDSSAPANKGGAKQKCIATLRKLSEQGLISQKQKRVLLTDIITSSARDESSVVEVAYELLVNDEEDASADTELDDGLEDFAEQCRVFAEDASE